MPKLLKNSNLKGVKFTETVPANRFVVVTGFDNEDAIIKVGICGENQPAYGICPTIMTSGVVDEVIVGDGAIAEIELAGTVSAGDELSSDANGKALKYVALYSTTGSLINSSVTYVNAIAEEAGLTGEVITVKLISPYKKRVV